MTIDTTVLRSKVARRIFLLFILCALLPITALAVVSYAQVTRQLNAQAQERLAQASKAHGMRILERLRLVEAEMITIMAGLSIDPRSSPGVVPTLGSDLQQRFSGLGRRTPDGAVHVLRGAVGVLPALRPAERKHLDDGGSLVSTSSSSGQARRVYMWIPLASADRGRPVLVGVINNDYLWSRDALSALADQTVLDETGAALTSSSSASASFIRDLAARAATAGSGGFEWSDGREVHLASYWTLFLKPSFFIPHWTVSLTESKNSVLAPVALFRTVFPLVILLSICVVIFLSLIQIRRNLVPLERLREGTRRIAEKDFATRVTVSSGDEFEELADSFNVMASQLAQQFEQLDRLSRGALQALARAIDAKSPWTAGHSERVTEMAIKIGRVMHLSAKELDILHRGGLLHDIGKIGTPAHILDKPGKLTDEELVIMRDHVRVGARILEPFPAFADVLHIVLEHHEWYNGQGYPAGTAGEALTRDGRIFAVADVFDAITSARPYRTGMPLNQAIAHIQNGAGRQFDPIMVEAFMQVMARERPETQAGASELVGASI